MHRREINATVVIDFDRIIYTKVYNLYKSVLVWPFVVLNSPKLVYFDFATESYKFVSERNEFA